MKLYFHNISRNEDIYVRSLGLDIDYGYYTVNEVSGVGLNDWEQLVTNGDVRKVDISIKCWLSTLEGFTKMLEIPEFEPIIQVPVYINVGIFKSAMNKADNMKDSKMIFEFEEKIFGENNFHFKERR